MYTYIYIYTRRVCGCVFVNSFIRIHNWTMSLLYKIKHDIIYYYTYTRVQRTGVGETLRRYIILSGIHLFICRSNRRHAVFLLNKLYIICTAPYALIYNIYSCAMYYNNTPDAIAKRKLPYIAVDNNGDPSTRPMFLESIATITDRVFETKLK